ncbi:SIMPL domain-containing protein [Neomegalonema perideroedes]|uniref:SIMPL domain-containing protein n=1 Tax=Neomegalonema perideroedes TaxID=217219 RepID=UPI000381DC38|nr:SIMPL domain-containing protein [Neomegalonema perideroedes]
MDSERIGARRFGGWSAVLGGLLIGAGVAFAGWAVGSSLVKMRQAGRTVYVLGLSERDVQATMGTWRLSFRGEGESRAVALADHAQAQKAVEAFLKQAGFSEAELTLEPAALRVERRVQEDGTETARYFAVGAWRVRSPQIAALRKASGETGALLDQDVWLGDSDYSSGDAPEYAFTEVNAVKPEMIAEATRAARASAQQFAEDSGSRLGAIASAEQGVVQILARDGGEYSERAEPEKKIRVVARVRYYLED